MLNEGSITHWLGKLKEGGPERNQAAQQLWQRYATKLLALARQHLGNAPRRVADEEDAVLVAFDRFCRAATEGRFPRLHDRNDLWQLLLVLTERAALNQRRDVACLKRGGGVVADVEHLEHVCDDQPTPAFAAQVAESFQLLLDRLRDDRLRQVALLRFEGYTHDEIARILGCSRPTVERRCALIRKRWEGE